MKLILIIFILFVGFFHFPNLVDASMSSTNFEIFWDSVGQGGTDTSSSTSYFLRDTLGNSGSGISTSSSYNLQAGYRSGIFDRVLSLEVEALSNATEMQASYLSGTTVTVNSTSTVSVNDLIILIQNKGAAEVDAIGRVVAKTGTTITTDTFKNAGTTPVIDGTNDYVYVLSGTDVSFGTLSTSSVKTTVVGLDVTADLGQGYTVCVFENQNLKNGSFEISDVSDGEVSAGNMEYGARSSDTSLVNSTFDTQDSAITTSFQEIATENSSIFESRNFLVLKAAIDSGSTEGSYSQTLSFVVSGNF